MGIDVTGLGSLAEAAKGIADKFWPDKTEVEKAKLAADLQNSMNEFGLIKGQLDINQEEAKSTNWFVAGWRPYIGWICGTGLAYSFLIMPIVNGIVGTSRFPALDTSTLLTCLGGLLGLGGLRTYEKVTGAEGNR